MIRLLIIFIVTFALGVLAAVVVRTNAHRPYAVSEAAPVSEKSVSENPVSKKPVSVTSEVHSQHGASPAMPAGAVNTICTICGMPVNPALGTVLYHEQRIGFGCKACPAKFAANPEKYGPSALKNVVVE